MTFRGNKKLYKKIALVLSICTVLLWSVLGTGASLAWFTDVSNQLTNIFQTGNFHFSLSLVLPEGNIWEEVDGQTKVFDENALYEPGYVEIVYLRVENTGTLAFEIKTAVNVNGCIMATNVFGQEFMLQDYLKFGTVIVDSEEEMRSIVTERKVAVAIADMPLHNYDTETAVVEPGETKYIVLVLRMPEEVGNMANYRGDTIPEVDLGLTVKAEQVRTY